MKHLAFLTLLLTILFLGTVSAEAANRYIRAGASGSATEMIGQMPIQIFRLT